MIAVVIIALWFLNPTSETHRLALRTELRHRIERAAAEQDILSGTLLWLAKDATVEAVVQQAEYHNYIFISTTTYEGQRTSFGICGRVFVSVDNRR